jgi:formylglycine-generating enzyme required for sulfatase activity
MLIMAAIVSALFVMFPVAAAKSNPLPAAPPALFLPVISCKTCKGIVPAEMAAVPAGSFQMGCSPNDSHCWNGEYPLHTVSLDAYQIDRSEVTNARYAACVNAGECSPPHDPGSATRTAYFRSSAYEEYPVVNVDWSQADAFCRWEGKRLPTEAEWERAARGAADTRILPWGDQEPGCSLANLFDINIVARCVGDTNAVGSYPAGASPSGALDMAGNAWEWVNDWQQDDYYRSLPAWDNPTGPAAGLAKGMRGGSWHDVWTYLRVSTRGAPKPDTWDNAIGFRCARSSANLPPYTPAALLPVDGTQGQPLDRQLSWAGGDIEGDSVSYTVYFEIGQITPTVVVAQGQAGLTYTPGTLSPGSVYSWRVVARDSHGASATGPVWRFTTAPAGFDARQAISVPAGDFQMGCSPADPSCQDNEKPPHTVYLDAYDIDRYEVTNARYQGCVEAGVCSPPHELSSHTRPDYFTNLSYASYPVIKVDWIQADAFCRWEGRRLPTEAEWEKAARGSSDTRLYPWGNQTSDCTRGNFLDAATSTYCVGDTQAVGGYPAGASPYGVMDLVGNAWEWVSDWYQDAYYGSQSTWTNPAGPSSGTLRVSRGGGWLNLSSDIRLTWRGRLDPHYWWNDQGFRCASSH